ncbi:SDR family NAD(P)-dependent oxidoreductase [Rhodovastum atsumiense]|uniref:SDR family NAD(P)-dependent oxidoreductase n=1 Tax=Rhodovastum atsumiense TaxID=504468 RepID=A0A5M6IVI0_9PROT|nr:SDR family NAD(P)-dependent oxidoreductase [Rhodovastum atsumiense]KAA5612231.1 SDR family NAD(P)-dependent oxidoreductase [Rhodovastum atsumiense]CAH2601552.1 SDR family NAD(P)-dependent oxidoreductase [Rhodovastum atsumiense]
MSDDPATASPEGGRPDTRPLAGRIALVTGASRGIGAAVAIELARRGAHVVITARTEGGLEETDDTIRAGGGSATLLPLDIKDGSSLDALGPSVFQRFRRLDILVSNAGSLGQLTPAPHILPKDWDDVVAVNATATWRLIRSCGPLLQAADAGRAVFVSSAIVLHPTAYWGAYGATKAAQHHLVRSWAEETRTTRLRVNLVDPGPVATKMRRSAFPGEDASKLPKPADIAPRIADLCGPGETRHGEMIRVSPVPA